MKREKIVVLGAGESGIGAAMLAKKQGYEVLVSDVMKIGEKRKKIIKKLAVQWEEGGHNIDSMSDAKMVVKSPGISNSSPIIKKLKSSGKLVISEIEFAARYTDATIIGITGTNGKTTTTMMTYQILKKAGKNVAMAGNIGNSFARMVATGAFDYYVLEISSFQLDDIYDFCPKVGVITNVASDHLDRYDYSFENYLNAKLGIAKNQTKGEFLILNVDDYHLKKSIQRLKSTPQIIPVSYDSLPSGVFYHQKGIHYRRNGQTCRIDITDLPVYGKQNVYNSMFASAVANVLKISNKDIRESLMSFKGAPHRMEKVLTIGKVDYINDSKGTNINATYFALDSIKSPIIWIVGGIDKGNDYHELLPLVRKKVKAIVCLGKDNEKLISFFSPISDIVCATQSMSEAVKACYRVAEYHDTVLLSPSCSSFDLFKNYEDRGHQFKEAVRKL
ncbi:MAG: UDP-N-acetylmuramoyl-L-alanine--D-glutamate ligase [Flavobacteriaceae bacterium]|nr:UDP-N-acetylmuramoyl-L-alanine--D-glutamate ligase [Flavobacteriaceae bacterium]